MTTPAPTITALPSTATLTLAAPTANITCTDTANGTYSPASTGKQWKVGGTAIPGATSNTASMVLRAQRAGALSVTLTVDNGTQGTSAGATVTVTDSLAANASAAAVGGVIPQPSATLPPEWRDPTIATPGLPTAAELISARTYGTVLPAAQQTTLAPGLIV